jgi:hypothetical protein
LHGTKKHIPNNEGKAVVKARKITKIREYDGSGAQTTVPRSEDI